MASVKCPRSPDREGGRQQQVQTITALDVARSPLRVQFLGLDNMEEAGIGEGVAKEFLVDVLKAGFDPALGLFLATPDGTLYPNPAASLRVADAYGLYEFLGVILAKTLYEGILVELPFAPFFLSRLLGRTNTVADMPYLDKALFDHNIGSSNDQ